MDIIALIDEALGTYGDTSYLIAAYPTNRTKEQIKEWVDGLTLSDPQDPDEYHITIRHWPNNDLKVGYVTDILRNRADIFKPLILKPFKMDVFGEENSLVIRVSGEIEQVFNEVDEQIRQIGIPPSTFPIYKPHLTVAAGVTELPELPIFNIECKLFRLTNINRETLWELEV